MGLGRWRRHGGHLVKSGYAVTGYDVSAARAEAAALAGVTLAASPAEAVVSATS